MVSYASRTERLKGKAADVWDLHFIAISAQKAQLALNPTIALNEKVIVLSVGDPDLDTPLEIKQATKTAIDQNDTHYSPLAGKLQVRQRLAEHLRPSYGNWVMAENVIITAGAQNALFGSAMTLLEEGDEVIVLEPNYVTYQALLGATGAKIVYLPCPPELGFRPDLARLEGLISPKTKAIFFANPVNPTGVVLGKAELEFLASAAIKHDLWLVVDEVYAELVFDQPFVHLTSFEGIKDRTVTISSLSKSHAMTGWRTGWAAGPKEFIANMESLALCMLYGLPGFIQAGMITALDHYTEIVQSMKNIYAKRIKIAEDILSKSNIIAIVSPDAGMFMLLDIRKTGLTSKQFAQKLYDDKQVCLLDASAFGPSLNGYLRLSLAACEADIETGCLRIIEFLNKN